MSVADTAYKVASQSFHDIIDRALAHSYWKWAGHVARSVAIYPRALLLWRSFEWLREQQQLSCSWRHKGKRGNLRRYEALLSRWAERNYISSWWLHAQDREQWSECFESFVHSLVVRQCEAVHLSGKRRTLATPSQLGSATKQTLLRPAACSGKKVVSGDFCVFSYHFVCFFVVPNDLPIF